MSTKDTLINVGLLAAGGVAIAAASGVYGKGSRAIRGMRYTLAYGGDNDSTIHVSGTFKPYSKAVDSAKKLAKRIGRTVEVREEGYDLVAFVEPSGRVDDGGYGKGSRATGAATYLVVSTTERDFDTDAPLYWSNKHGWTTKRSATRFSEDEKARLRLPMGGAWEPVGKGSRSGSMTRDGSYESTLMFDADEDDPTVRAQRQLQANPYVPQSRPLTAEPPRITSAQGSTARGSSSVLRGMTAKPGTPQAKGSRAARWVPDGDGFRRTDVHPGDEVEVLYVKGINMYRINMYLPYVKCAGHVLNFDAALPLAKAKYEASQAYDTQRAYNDYIRRSRN